MINDIATLQNMVKKRDAIIKEHLIKPLNPSSVLDPFMGSGTTAIAAKKTNRHYILYEISEDYVELAKNRLQSS